MTQVGDDFGPGSLSGKMNATTHAYHFRSFGSWLDYVSGTETKIRCWKDSRWLQKASNSQYYNQSMRRKQPDHPYNKAIELYESMINDEMQRQYS